MRSILTIVVLLSPPSGVLAQLGGTEFWFDGPEAVQPGSDREDPDVAVDGMRRTIVAWQANSNGQDVYVRRFDEIGAPLEDPILVNTTIENSQRFPSVAAAADGSFVVVWVNRVDIPPDRGVANYSIRSRHFGSDGLPTASEQIVNQLDPTFGGGSHLPDVAALTGGGFVVVWRSSTTNGDDSSTSIQGRLLNASGTPVGTQFQVNTTTDGLQSSPNVDGLPAVDPDGDYDGGFVVAWNRPGVHVRRFRADGTSGENDLQIDIDNDGERTDMAVAQHTGQVAVAWYFNDAVRTRLLDSNLSFVSGQLMASAVSDTTADHPTISDVGLDGFYLAWDSSTGPTGTDASGDSIQARILQVDGTFEGPQFQVNTWIMNNQQQPALGSSDGRLGIAWRSAGNPVPGANLADDHIIGYLLNYCDGIFCDDFESGDTTAWSTSVP
ncbi:MAG: hypothetical protein DWQ36_01650 [Acidobacteria bacterium]|nr:MAG: hypothetical protein DWQ30_16490 [Acidobacteriota bacterium]REK11479.1 MAG: hypothetical protein DWQ36_01650 [Acidobacteriota bacterium]